tara:strand:- start:293 stop:559 length:267 start_codon:yes stop_codon:yes gene_type:complete
MKYKISNSCIISEFDGGAIVFHIEKGIYYELNKTGKKIISIIKEKENLEDILTLMLDGQTTEIEEKEEQIEFFLEDLIKKEIVENIKT